MYAPLVLCLFLSPIVFSFPQGVYIKDGNVGASFGGYSASAGLGGILGGGGPRGGLHAEAGTPGGHYAGAGLGGSVSEGGPQGGLYSGAGLGGVQPVAVGGSQSQASSSASASSSSGGGGGGYVGGVQPVVYKTQPAGSFFDNIFNIPISTLNAVNRYLNNRQQGVIHVRAKHVPLTQANVVPSGASSSSSSASSSSSSSASSASSSSADSSANAGGSPGVAENSVYLYQKPVPNYDNIFNIPISVLGAVSKFLSGK